MTIRYATVSDQLYLTRVTLTPAGTVTARHDRRALHTALAKAVDDGTPGDHRARMLWCLPNRRTVLVQSPTPVDPATLAGLGTITGTSIIPQPETGARVELSTICNPIRRSGSKHAALPPAARHDWLTERLRPAVDIDTVTIEALRNTHVRKPDRVATFTPVGYYATGTVTDPDMLAGLVTSGIGSGKAYGFGMLLVAEVPA